MKKKLIRITTADISLFGLLKGQLHFLNNEFEVVGLAADTGVLKKVGEREGIRVIGVPMHREISVVSDFKCLMRLIHIFRMERPFIVHSNTPKGSLLSMIAATIVSVPNRLYLVTGLRYQGATGAVKWLLKTMERITCLCATKVIPEGEGVRKTLIKDRITDKPLEVIHNGNINGIDTTFFSREASPRLREDIRSEIGLTKDDFAFIFIGRIVRDKGMNELAQTMRSLERTHPTAKLILVGPFESELDPLASCNEEFFKTSNNVKYVGQQADVRPFLLAADALVFPSYREGFPNVVLQAGAMGLPSIVTDINGCNEVITEGFNGVIIPPRNRDALVEKMTWFIEHPKEVKEMALNSRDIIVTKYERKDVWNALLQMYKKLD